MLARRTVSIRDRQLRRVEAPEGIFQLEDGGADGWKRLEREAPRLAGGQGAALRAHDVGGTETRRLGTGGKGFRRRADKHLPDIAGLIDPHQFDLITKPSSGFVVIRGTAGSGKTTVRSTGSRTSPTTIRASTLPTRSSSTSRRLCATT